MSLDSLLTDIFYCSGHLQRKIFIFIMKDCRFVASVQITKNIKIIELEIGISWRYW